MSLQAVVPHYRSSNMSPNISLGRTTRSAAGLSVSRAAAVPRHTFRDFSRELSRYLRTADAPRATVVSYAILSARRLFAIAIVDTPFVCTLSTGDRRWPFGMWLFVRIELAQEASAADCFERHFPGVPLVRAW